MFGKFSEQMKKSTQPAASLFEMNAKSLALMSQQNTVFLSGLMDDSVKLLSTLSEQSELNGFIAAQSVYAESVRERFTSASKTTYSELNELHTQIKKIASTSIDTTLNQSNTKAERNVTPVKVTAETQPIDKAPSKQTAVKNKAATSTKPSVTNKAKPLAKTVKKKVVTKVASKGVDKKARPKASANKANSKAMPTLSTKAPTTGESLVAKDVSAKKASSTTQVNATSVPATKTVAKLSPADVKAVGKK
jgi:hypothetical protein